VTAKVDTSRPITLTGAASFQQRQRAQIRILTELSSI
jgi:hypothetical protein